MNSLTICRDGIRCRLLLVLCLMLPPAVSADEAFWVLGNFATKEVAITEGKRISAGTGIEVLMYPIEADGSAGYRLLASVLADAEDQASLRFQLEKVDIAVVLEISLPGSPPHMQSIFADLVLEEYGDSFDDYDYEYEADFDEEKFEAEMARLDAESNFYYSGQSVSYIVAGSFQSIASAQAHITQIGLIPGWSIAMVDAEVNGVIYQRVLVGPVIRHDESRVIALLADLGFAGAWPLRNVPLVPGTSADLVAVPEIEIRRTPEPPEKIDAEPNGFNLAKLKMRSANWSDPRKKK